MLLLNLSTLSNVQVLANWLLVCSLVSKASGMVKRRRALQRIEEEEKETLDGAAQHKPNAAAERKEQGLLGQGGKLGDGGSQRPSSASSSGSSRIHAARP